MTTASVTFTLLAVLAVTLTRASYFKEEDKVGFNNKVSKVKVELYLESLCPFCKKVLINTIYPTYHVLKDIMNVSFVPYGNAMETRLANGTWKYDCQHGHQECIGNAVENCMLHFVTDMNNQVEYMQCLESNGPVTSGQHCASKLKLSGLWPKIKACSTSAMGNKLVHMAAVKTDQLKPAHQWVPWIVVNGKHNDTIDTASYKLLKETVCDKYQGKKPAACDKLPQRSQR